MDNENNRFFLFGLFTGLAIGALGRPLTNKQLQAMRKRRKRASKRRNKLLRKGE